MKKSLLILIALTIFGLPAVAHADTLTFFAPATAANVAGGGPNQVDLDHHNAYTWRIDEVNLAGQRITGATLMINNISNWDVNPNVLFIHLLDSARASGLSSFTDAPANQVPVTNMDDNFAGQLYLVNPLVEPGTANTFLTSQSFTMNPVNFSYQFTAEQLLALSAYIANGNNLALGFDPDCHFWNNGITLQISTAPAAVPEPTTVALLGSGLAGLLLRRRRQNPQARKA